MSLPRRSVLISTTVTSVSASPAELGPVVVMLDFRRFLCRGWLLPVDASGAEHADTGADDNTATAAAADAAAAAAAAATVAFSSRTRASSTSALFCSFCTSSTACHRLTRSSSY